MQEFGISAGLQMCRRLQLGELLSKLKKTTTAGPDFKHASILLPCVASADEHVHPDCGNGVSRYSREERKLGEEVMNEVRNQLEVTVSSIYFFW